MGFLPNSAIRPTPLRPKPAHPPSPGLQVALRSFLPPPPSLQCAAPGSMSNWSTRVVGRAGPKDEETYYDAVKREMVARQAATRALLEGLDPATRLSMEGHRPGAYVRMRFRGKAPGADRPAGRRG